MTPVHLQLPRKLDGKKTAAQWLEASREGDCILVGDCNIDILKWNNPDAKLAKLINILENNIITQGFTQLIKSPTRFWPGCPSSIIDHIWTNCPLKIRNHRNITRSISDHNVTEVTLASKSKFQNVQESIVRKKCTLSPGQLCEEMEKQDWTLLYNTDDVDVAYNVLEENINRVLDLASPMVKIQPSRTNKDWITNESRKQFTIRDNLRNVAARTGMDNDWREYKQQRNKCALLAKNYKKNYFTKKYENCEAEGNIGGMYSLTKKQLGWTSGNNPQTFLLDGNTTSSPKAMPEIQNNYFMDKVDKLVEVLPDSEDLPDPLHHLKSAMNRWEHRDKIVKLTFKETTEEEVKKLIKKFKNYSSSFGHDKLDSKTLKITSSVLISQITRVINLSNCKNLNFPTNGI